MKRILVLRNLSLHGSTRKYYKTYTGTSYLILVLRSISWSYGTILVLLNLFLYFKSYSCTKVPVGTISQNRSESYHIQGQIRRM